MDRSVLVVAATRAEAKYVPPGARLLITGIGKVRAASALTRVLTESASSHDHRPGGDREPPVRSVVNVGTAGALHDHHVGLFRPSVVVEHDISSAELRSMGYPVVDRWELPDGDGTVLASGDTFVADPIRRAGLAQIADLVDMEGCALAHVSAEFGVPCRMVKVVSDGADEGALDWPTLVDAAARQLGEWLDVEWAW
ncbi:nucleosidase [Gordonia sp. OPL2]|uniref:nucleosidase n=1 Tax=Gordonia sp. OPL2 TaxID=2486274 RepID=UPI001654DB8E|nr:nucleosidase [Gordonia sp. OPL2]ROZ93795.1 nucleosidase [Gordonia sp. OPL2]